ncbi:hypothetical protein HA402_002525 [Bradysia odoriphaga]|nr:hypothetical protein HA402_002525 [Bradysia odoriphaga]
MENDRILMAVVTGAVVTLGAFVFWGPSGSSRLRQRRGQIAGLHNFGRTCFLNTLLQALAACPQFIAWMQLHGSADKKSLIGSLLNTLEVINGTHPTLRSDPYSPGAVIRALNNLGWVIPPEDQDCHELLHVLLTSLEEEAVRPKKIGCLSDALGDVMNTPTSAMGPPRPSSAMLSDFLKSDYDESTSLMRQARSEAHTPDSPHSMCTDDDQPDEQMLDQAIMSPMIMPEYRKSRVRNLHTHQANGGHGDHMSSKRNSLSCRSLERLSRGPGRVSVYGEKSQIQIPHPFRGAQSSQMICSNCGFKSVVRYDKFDSVSLPLPEIRRSVTLANLMTEYIATESLTGVACESCDTTCDHTKSVTFAKLPACLCIHISRNTWLPTGQVSKRQDYVSFPESLSMAPYSFIQPSLSQASTPWGSTVSLLSSSLPMNGRDSFSSYTFGAMFPRNLYRLLAVVVHTGEANRGHFVTYRRGALRNSHRWYYTSDTVVKEVSIDEVLSINAYMLFYDRGPQRQGM